jgi:hypothetical protein
MLHDGRFRHESANCDDFFGCYFANLPNMACHEVRKNPGSQAACMHVFVVEYTGVHTSLHTGTGMMARRPADIDIILYRYA